LKFVKKYFNDNCLTKFVYSLPYSFDTPLVILDKLSENNDHQYKGKIVKHDNKKNINLFGYTDA